MDDDGVTQTFEPCLLSRDRFPPVLAKVGAKAIVGYAVPVIRVRRRDRSQVSDGEREGDIFRPEIALETDLLRRGDRDGNMAWQDHGRVPRSP